ncbi:MAG: hypothetical protein Q9227_007526 [Pyrenula ochraceoflavens]
MLPRIAEPSIWKSIVPRFLRREGQVSTTPKQKAQKQKTPNPATFFIAISILIGSQSIRIIGAKKEHEAYIRKMDAKLELLRRVVESIKRGEDVDVEKMLGTGDAQKELIKEIESEDSLWHSRGNSSQKKKAGRDKQAPTPKETNGPSNTEMMTPRKPPIFWS